MPLGSAATGDDSRSSLERARRGTHSVSERPRLTVSRPERARRRSTVDVTNGFRGHALPVSASRVPLPSRLVVWSSVLCGRPPPSPPVRRGSAAAAAARRPRTGRARADGERRRSPRVSVGVVRRRPCEVQRVARARLDRPSSGWRASCFGGATSGRPGVVFQFTFLTRVCTVTFVCAARGPLVEARSSRVDVDSVRQTDRHSWRWITGFVRR